MMSGADTPVDVGFFRNLIETEKHGLAGQCSLWRELLLKCTDIPASVEGEILLAIGQAELLMKERFTQFSGLIDDCEFKTGERETTCQDLQGFWDMVYFQVEDVQRKFRKLMQLKNTNWIEPKPNVPAVHKKSVPVLKSVVPKNVPRKPKVFKTTGNSVRDHILAARQRLKGGAQPKQEGIQCYLPISKEPCAQLATEDKENQSSDKNISQDNTGFCKAVLAKSPEKNVFDAGFFKVVTPVKKFTQSTSLKRCHSPACMVMVHEVIACCMMVKTS